MIYPTPELAKDPATGQHNSNYPFSQGPFQAFNKKDYYVLESYPSFEAIPSDYIDYFLGKDKNMNSFEKRLSNTKRKLKEHGLITSERRKQTSIIIFDSISPSEKFAGEETIHEFYQEVRKNFQKTFRVYIRSNRLNHLIHK